MKERITGYAGASPEYLGEREVERLIGISTRTLQKWRLLGRGPRFFRLNGRAVRYRRADVEAWAAAQPTGGER